MLTNIVFEVPSEGDKPRIACGIYPLKGGHVGMMCVGDDCFVFTPSAALLDLVGARRPASSAATPPTSGRSARTATCVTIAPTTY